MDRVEQLSKIELFAGLKPQAFELIAKVATEESHALGTKIFQHGDAGDKLYVIIEGKVRISRDVPGYQVPLGSAKTGTVMDATPGLPYRPLVYRSWPLGVRHTAKHDPKFMIDALRGVWGWMGFGR